MEMQGERRIPAPRQAVWEKLNDPEALKQLTPRVYQELRRMAAHFLQNERPGCILWSPEASTTCAFLLIMRTRIHEQQSHICQTAPVAMGFRRGGLGVFQLLPEVGSHLRRKEHFKVA